jgi:hypothetical protein
MADASPNDPSMNIEHEIRVTIESELLLSVEQMKLNVQGASDSGRDGQSASPNPVQLPLRQVSQPVANSGPKVWDITERFTEASKGLLILFFLSPPLVKISTTLLPSRAISKLCEIFLSLQAFWIHG